MRKCVNDYMQQNEKRHAMMKKGEKSNNILKNIQKSMENIVKNVELDM